MNKLVVIYFIARKSASYIILTDVHLRNVVILLTEFSNGCIECLQLRRNAVKMHLMVQASDIIELETSLSRMKEDATFAIKKMRRRLEKK